MPADAALRAPVEVLLGRAPTAVDGIRGDFALMEEAAPPPRTWTCAEHAVVLGVSRALDDEVDLAACRAAGVAVLRRTSGGGTVVISPGTVQYAVVIPHVDAAAPGLDEARRLANALVLDALRRAGAPPGIAEDPSGDLVLGDRKVGGLALRRRRDATMIHGTLLLGADLDLVARVLRHPVREPAWRRGRSHAEFVANLAGVDPGRFRAAMQTPP